MTNRKNLLAAVFLAFGVATIAWGTHTVIAFQPVACGGTLKLGFVDKIVYLAQNGASPMPCGINRDNTCAAPGSSCVDATTGDHGKCTTQGLTCACLKNTPGPNKKK